jgi:DNA (cytosine-5)-methyltransferase 1
MSALVLSLFPGIGLLDMAFEEVGFCVVRGPDLLWGGDVSPEFERCIREAQPTWWLMENVVRAPVAVVDGYTTVPLVLNNRWLGAEQNRLRRFCFGSQRGLRLRPAVVALESIDWASAVTSAHPGERRTHSSKSTGGRIPLYSTARALELQGLPADFFDRFEPECPLKDRGKLKLLANGVPLPMGRAIARAVLEATAQGQRLEAAP